MNMRQKFIIIAAAFVATMAGAATGQMVGKVPSEQPTMLKKACREVEGMSTTGDIIKNREQPLSNKMFAWGWDAYSGTVSEYPAAFPIVLCFMMVVSGWVVIAVIRVFLKEGKLYVAMFMQWKFPGLVDEAHKKIHEAQGRYTPESLRVEGAKLIKQLEGT